MTGPPSRSSIPSLSGEPSRRRLGTGSAGGRERPVRAQIVVAFVVALTLVAVPLYLMRRPASESVPAPDAGVDAGLPALVTSRPVESADAGKPPERIKLGPPERVRCGAGRRGGQQGTLCDKLPVLEEALAKAIRDSEKCAPRTRQAGSINHVMTVDFERRALHVFPGASGDFRGPQARRTTACVKRALPNLEWDSIRHQYKHYTIAILATYSPPAAAAPPDGAPKFE